MTSVPVREPPLSRSGLGDEVDWTLKHYGTKADVGDLDGVDCWVVAGCGAELGRNGGDIVVAFLA